MVEITKDHRATVDVTGKQLHHIARYDEPRPVGPDRSVLDVVTRDGSVYRFARLREGEPFKFEPGQGRDNRVSRSGRLPGVVEAVLDADLGDRGYVY